jgi:hypothetical protein
MSYERQIQIKRTVYTATCTCGERDVREDRPPREKLCKCGTWVPYIEQSYIGPELAR